MEQITEDYVSFENAKLLKEKGFAEMCHFYEYKGKREQTWYKNDSMFPDRVYIPTQALVVKWLRVKHGINFNIFPYTYRNKIMYEIRIFGHSYRNSGFKTPEEAKEAVILYCLQNLIK